MSQSSKPSLSHNSGRLLNLLPRFEKDLARRLRYLSVELTIIGIASSNASSTFASVKSQTKNLFTSVKTT